MTRGSQYTNCFNAYTPVSLNEMDDVKLMDRIDTKYVFNATLLEEIISLLQPHYKILTINNHNIFPYSTVYFDTPNFEMYNHHLNGKLNRFKVRFRKYDTFSDVFMEIKLKTNKRQTQKKRVKLADEAQIPKEAQQMAEAETGYKFSELRQSLTNKFNRITLVNNNFTERLTFDIDLSFQNDTFQEELPNLVIAELKQARYTSISPFYLLMKDRGIRKLGISKYCLGMVLLNPELKWNSFKPKLLQIQKITSKLQYS